MSKKPPNYHPVQSQPSSVVIGPDGQPIPAGTVVTQRAEYYSYSGPLPSPEVLQKFNEIVPGAADRILVQFEEQSRHRRTLETKALNGENSRANWGMVCGFIIGMTALGGAIYLALSDHQLAGGIIGSGGIIGLTAVFVYGSRAKRNDLKQHK